MSVTRLTPEQRRRSLLMPEPVFTASQAGVEVQRRFLLLQRLFFAAAVALGLGSMWGIAYLRPVLFPLAHWVALFVAVLCFAVTLVVRRKNSGAVQTLFFYTGWAALGIGVGCALGLTNRPAFANMTIMVGSAVLGCLGNAALTRKQPLSPHREFLFTGPWLLVGCAAVFVFFPAGEWALLLSGIAALVVLFAVHQAALLSLERYMPREYVVAAADIIPLAVLATWRRVSGEA
jgi:FtsH-binding integral membrane protein